MRPQQRMVMRGQRPIAWLVTGLTVFGTLLTACTGNSFTVVSSPTGDAVAIIPVFSPAQTQAACDQVGPALGGDTLKAIMTAANWAPGCIPLYTDDQRFNNGQGGYGPLAHVAPLPGDMLPTRTQFEVSVTNSILVGVVVVDDTTGVGLPSTYTGLHLTRGANCVFLRHNNGAEQTGGWHAYINQPVAGTCSAPNANTPDLPVRVETASLFSASPDYPAVGRFHEAKIGNQPVTLVGLKCAAGFCFIQPDVSNMQSDHIQVHPNARTWEVHGWGDEQHPGMPAAVGPLQAQWSYNASIIPAPNLGNMKVKDFENNDTALVAIIHLKTDPPGGSKYATKWHLEKGEENYIFLSHDSSKPKTDGWTGKIRHHFTPTLADKIKKNLFGIDYEWELKVDRHDHTGVPILGTARFAWSETDEDDWARCDEGCCYVGVK